MFYCILGSRSFGSHRWDCDRCFLLRPIRLYHEEGIERALVHSNNFIPFQQLAVTWNSFSFDMWEETPIPMYMNIYYFNVTNAEEVMEDLQTMAGPDRIKPRWSTGIRINILKICSSWSDLSRLDPTPSKNITRKPTSHSLQTGILSISIR